MKLILSMKWIEARDEWHLLDKDGDFVYDLKPCKNVKRLFDYPDKTKIEKFIVDIHRLEDTRGSNP